MLDDGQSFSGAELLRYTRLCHAITYASLLGLTLREGLALRRRQPAFFGEAPLRRRVAGHERGAGLRVLNFGPSPIPAISPVPGAKKGQSVPQSPPPGGREWRGFGAAPFPWARGDRVLEKCGLEVSHRCTRPRSVRAWQLA